MEIKNIDIIESAHQVLAHPAKGWIVEVAMVGDHSHDAMPGLLNFPLGKPEKLDVIVLEPFRVLLTQRLAIYLLVIVNQPLYPVTLVARMARIGWITQDAKNRRLFLDLAGKTGFFGKSGIERHVGLFEFLRIKGIREIEGHTLIVGKPVAKLFEKKAHLEVADRVGGHHQLKSVEVLEDMPTDKILFSATAVFILELGDGFSSGASNKSHGPRCRVQ